MAIISARTLMMAMMSRTIDANGRANMTNGTAATTWSFAGANGWSASQLFFKHEGPVTDVAFSDDGGAFYSVSKDETTVEYVRKDSSSFEFSQMFNDHTDWIESVAVAGQFVATAGEDGMIYVRGGDCDPCELTATNGVGSLFFTNDENEPRMLMATDGEQVMVWNASTPVFSKLSPLTPGKGVIGSASVTDSLLATSNGNLLVFTSVADNSVIQELTTECQLHGLSFTSDGTAISGFCDDKIYGFEYDSATEGFKTAGKLPMSGVTCIGWSLDGEHLAAGSTTGEISVWKTANLSEEPQTMQSSHGVSSLEFNMVVGLLLVGDNGGSVSLLEPPMAPTTTTTVAITTTTENDEVAAVVATGSIVMQVKNATTFCGDAQVTAGVAKAMATSMSVPEDAVEAECVVGMQETNRRLQAGEVVTFKYTITVELSSELDMTAAVAQLNTALDVLQQMDEAVLSAAIVMAISQTTSTQYTVTVTEVSSPELFSKGGAEDAPLVPLTTASSTASSTAVAGTTTGNDTDTTTEEQQEPGRADESAAMSPRRFAMSAIALAVLVPFA